MKLQINNRSLKMKILNQTSLFLLSIVLLSSTMLLKDADQVLARVNMLPTDRMTMHVNTKSKARVAKSSAYNSQAHKSQNQPTVINSMNRRATSAVGLVSSMDQYMPSGLTGGLLSTVNDLVVGGTSVFRNALTAGQEVGGKVMTLQNDMAKKASIDEAATQYQAINQNAALQIAQIAAEKKVTEAQSAAEMPGMVPALRMRKLIGV